MHDHLKRKRVVTNQWGHVTLGLSEHRLGRFAVIVHGGALTDPDHAIVLNLDDQHGLVRRDTTGNLEGFVKGQVLDACADLHARYRKAQGHQQASAILLRTPS